MYGMARLGVETGLMLIMCDTKLGYGMSVISSFFGSRGMHWPGYILTLSTGESSLRRQWVQHQAAQVGRFPAQEEDEEGQESGHREESEDLEE